MTGITIEHAQIRSWTDSRGGKPMLITPSEEITLPDISFVPTDPDNGKLVPWEEWLNIFDRDLWAFIYQDDIRDGQPSRFCKVVPRFA